MKHYTRPIVQIAAERAEGIFAASGYGGSYFNSDGTPKTEEEILEESLGNTEDTEDTKDTDTAETAGTTDAAETAETAETAGTTDAAETTETTETAEPGLAADGGDGAQEAGDTGDAGVTEAPTDTVTEDPAGTLDDTGSDGDSESFDYDFTQDDFNPSAGDAPGCDSLYMNGVWQAPDYSSWAQGEVRGYKDQFGCLGCPAYTGDGCGLLTHYVDSGYASSYDVDNGNRMPGWERKGYGADDPVYDFNV